MFLIIVFFTSLHLLVHLAHLFHLLSHLLIHLPAISYQFACSPLAVGKTGTDCLKALTEVHLTLLASLFPSFLDHFPKVQNPPKLPQRIDHFTLLLPSFPKYFPKSKNCLKELSISHYCCRRSPRISPNHLMLDILTHAFPPMHSFHIAAEDWTVITANTKKKYKIEQGVKTNTNLT